MDYKQLERDIKSTYRSDARQSIEERTAALLQHLQDE